MSNPYDEAARRNRDGADALLEVAREKRAAAVDDYQADKSRRNAEKARRDGWTGTGPSRS